MAYRLNMSALRDSWWPEKPLRWALIFAASYCALSQTCFFMGLAIVCFTSVKYLSNRFVTIMIYSRIQCGRVDV
jgi:hypothetical protein